MIESKTVTVSVCDVCGELCEPCGPARFLGLIYDGRDVQLYLEASFHLEIYNSGKSCVCEKCAKKLMQKWCEEAMKP